MKQKKAPGRKAWGSIHPFEEMEETIGATQTASHGRIVAPPVLQCSKIAVLHKIIYGFTLIFG